MAVPFDDVATIDVVADPAGRVSLAWTGIDTATVAFVVAESATAVGGG